MKTILTKDGYLLDKSKFKKQKLAFIKNELTVAPYNSFLAKMNKNYKQDSFNVYREDEKYLSIPKFYGLKEIGLPDKNDEIEGEKVKLKFKGKLRDYQKDIVKKSLKHIKTNDGGLISVGCGRGKTVMALNIACKLKLKTLVIVHKGFLLNQWKERIEQFTNASVGIIQQKKNEVYKKDIVIGMLQSIAKDNYDLDIFRDFGFVIFDEAHHAPSKYFSRALPLISCKKSLALSATPNRSDKLEKILYWYMGDLIHKDENTTKFNVDVEIYHYNCNHKEFKEYKMRFTGDINKPKTITKLCKIENRNKFIVSKIEELCKIDLRRILILSDRIEHLEILHELLNEKKLESDYYIGGRKQSLLDKAAECKVILATFSMAAEALDIPELNCLLMLTPRTSIEQSVGRILRKQDKRINPLIIDLVDRLESLDKQGKRRIAYYKKKDYNITHFDVEEDKIKEKDKKVKKEPEVVDFLD